MSWGGKILGATVGAMAGGPVGAALGALLGHQFDAAAEAPLRDPQPDPLAVNRLFFPALFRVMGYVARGRGVITEAQINAARTTMAALHLDSAQEQLAISFFLEGKEPVFALKRELQPLYGALMFYPELAQFFMEIQVQTAIGGQAMGPGVRARLVQAGALLGLDAGDMAYLERVFTARFRAGADDRTGAGSGTGTRRNGAGQLAAAYALLGVAANGSDDEVRLAYRRLVSKHHPDKLAASGLPEAMLEKAKERTQEIRAAYELICEQRGMA